MGSIEEMVAEVSRYVPGYRLKQRCRSRPWPTSPAPSSPTSR